MGKRVEPAVGIDRCRPDLSGSRARRSRSRWGTGGRSRCRERSSPVGAAASPDAILTSSGKLGPSDEYA
jgi:hypothetical protein